MPPPGHDAGPRESVSGALHDLRGGPDIAVVDAGNCPQADGRAFFVHLPPLAPTSSSAARTRSSVGVERPGEETPASSPSLTREAREKLRDVIANAAKAGATGIVLPGLVGTPDLERLGAMLAVAETEHGLSDGLLSIIGVLDGPAGILALPSLRPTPRLAALACDPAGLATSLGCDDAAPAIVTARAMTVFAASACGVPAVLVCASVEPALRREALSEGFAALLAPDAPAS